MKFKKLIVSCAFTTLALASCTNKEIKPTTITTELTLEVTKNISKDTKFSSCIVDITESDFKNYGFTLGDSLDVEFSNGFSLKDVPYFNGYYVKTGKPVVVSYPGYNNVSITYNNQGIWDQAKLTESDTVTIKLNSKAKYITTQEALSQSYSNKLEDYTDKYEFANFRSMKGGALKENLLYRGASPCDNSHNRASTVDSILKEYNITYNIDLADSTTNMENYLENTSYDFPYTKALYQNNNVSLLSLSSSYEGDAYKQAVVRGLTEALDKSNESSKIYIHCMEGKDRTGFVCLLIEALCGATYNEMKDDYMQTYYNYYKINEENSKSKYDAIVELYFNTFLESLHKTSDLDTLTSASYVSDAKAYLTSGGMSSEKIEELITFLTK